MLERKKTNSISVGFCKFIVKSHWQTVLFAILYIVSLSVGAILFFTASPDIYEQFCRLSGEYLLSRSQWEKAFVFVSSFLSVFWFLLLFFLLGTFPFGKLLTYPLIFLRGLGGGIMIAAVYCQNEASHSLLLISFLHAVIFLFAGALIWSDKSRDKSQYEAGFLMLALFCAATALLDMFLTS